jgi:hypothetical protein
MCRGVLEHTMRRPYCPPWQPCNCHLASNNYSRNHILHPLGDGNSGFVVGNNPAVYGNKGLGDGNKGLEDGK